MAVALESEGNGLASGIGTFRSLNQKVFSGCNLLSNNKTCFSSPHWLLKWFLSFQINFLPFTELQKTPDLFDSIPDTVLVGGMGQDVNNLRTGERFTN